MAEVLLFHHVLGRTIGIEEFADRLRGAGHTVHVPDLFEGRTFSSIEDGMRYVEEMGFDEIVERGVRVADELPREVIYAGFSFGVVAAQKLAQTREGALGALFIGSCVSIAMFETPWPVDLPAQIHGMDADPYFVDEGDLEAARTLVEEANRAELFLYRGDRHLFADSSLPSYDAEATELLLQRVIGFLRQLDITYEFVETVDGAEVAGVFRESGIRRPVDDVDRIQRMVDNADIIVTARSNGQLVGIARAITDYSYCCYLSDLAVDARYQRSGIGKELVRLIQERLGDEVTLLLVAAPNAVDYYPRIGFERLDSAFSIRRKR